MVDGVTSNSIKNPPISRDLWIGVFLDVEHFVTVQRSRSLRSKTQIFNDDDLKQNLKKGFFMDKLIGIVIDYTF